MNHRSGIVVGLVIVSHHPKIAEGVAELVREMSYGHVTVRAAAGDADGAALGTSPGRILEAIRAVEDAAQTVDEILLFVDVGSSVLCAKALLDQEPGLKERARVVDAPIVEGALAAAVAAFMGKDADGCVEAAKHATTIPKLR